MDRARRKPGRSRAELNHRRLVARSPGLRWHGHRRAARGVIRLATRFGTHYERPTTAPDGTGHVPAYRTGEQHLRVCKNDPTDFEKRIAGFAQHLQDYN